MSAPEPRVEAAPDDRAERIRRRLPTGYHGPLVQRKGLLSKRHIDDLTEMSWAALRRRVWDRMGGECFTCGRLIYVDEYECGHIIDRCVGGTDRVSNLVPMCMTCNRLDKPLHETIDSFVAWVCEPRIQESVIARMMALVRSGAFDHLPSREKP